MRDVGIYFSGGKDSIAALYVSRPLLSRAIVYFADAGAYPHINSFVHATCNRLGAMLRVVRPLLPLEDYHAVSGLPADIVPVEASPDMQPYVKRTGMPVLQSHLACCRFLLWEPLHRAAAADGIKCIIRGSKACDPHVGVPDGFVDKDGILYRSPLWNWTDADVLAYLRQSGVELPAHYREGSANFNWDCILCTAYLNAPGTKSRLEYTRKHYPEIWPKLAERLKIVRGTIDEERAQLDQAFSLIDHPLNEARQ